jgi:hypothetical protein
MKDKEPKIEEIEDSHTRWSSGRSYPGDGTIFQFYEVYYMN